MSEDRLEKLARMVAGLIVTQQALADALIRHEALGYHQLHEALADAEEQLANLEGEIGSETVIPIRKTLHAIEALHAPHQREERTPAPDWQAAIRDALERT